MAYNGWKNYETWNVALWIDNDEGTYRERCALARRAGSVEDLAASLKSWVEDMAPDLGASMFSDLLTAALGEVDWDESAENWYEEAQEDDEEEEEAEV